MPRNTDVLAAAESQLGKSYRVTSCRCSEDCYSRDCSGLVIFSCNHCGMNLPCTSSFGLARMGQAAGTLIGYEQAAVTPGALAIRNGFGSPNGPNGSNGHVVFCKGDGVSTVEAMGTAYGIVRGRLADRGFETFMLIPGVDYSPPVVIDWDAIEKLVHFQQAVAAHPLRYGDTSNLVTQLNQLLAARGLEHSPGNTYGHDTRTGVAHLERAKKTANQDPTKFGSETAAALLAPKAA